MKFKEYVEQLLALLHEKPATGDMEVVYSSDDEGNNYQKVVYDPGLVGHFDGNYRGDFVPQSEAEKHPGDYPDFKPNAVCIN